MHSAPLRILLARHSLLRRRINRLLVCAELLKLKVDELLSETIFVHERKFVIHLPTSLPALRTRTVYDPDYQINKELETAWSVVTKIHHGLCSSSLHFAGTWSLFSRLWNMSSSWLVKWVATSILEFQSYEKRARLTDRIFEALEMRERVALDTAQREHLGYEAAVRDLAAAASQSVPPRAARAPTESEQHAELCLAPLYELLSAMLWLTASVAQAVLRGSQLISEARAADTSLPLRGRRAGKRIQQPPMQETTSRGIVLPRALQGKADALKYFVQIFAHLLSLHSATQSTLSLIDLLETSALLDDSGDNSNPDMCNDARNSLVDPHGVNVGAVLGSVTRGPRSSAVKYRDETLQRRPEWASFYESASAALGKLSLTFNQVFLILTEHRLTDDVVSLCDSELLCSWAQFGDALLPSAAQLNLMICRLAYQVSNLQPESADVHIGDNSGLLRTVQQFTRLQHPDCDRWLEDLLLNYRPQYTPEQLAKLLLDTKTEPSTLSFSALVASLVRPTYAQAAGSAASLLHALLLSRACFATATHTRIQSELTVLQLEAANMRRRVDDCVQKVRARERETLPLLLAEWQRAQRQFLQPSASKVYFLGIGDEKAFTVPSATSQQLTAGPALLTRCPVTREIIPVVSYAALKLQSQLLGLSVRQHAHTVITALRAACGDRRSLRALTATQRGHNGPVVSATISAGVVCARALRSLREAARQCLQFGDDGDGPVWLQPVLSLLAVRALALLPADTVLWASGAAELEYK